MRAIILTFLTLLFFASNTSAQKPKRSRIAKVTTTAQVAKKVPETKSPGFILASDLNFTTEDGKSFVVYDAPGYTQKELYNAVLVGLAKIYKYPDKVLSTVDPSLIKINAITAPCINYYSSYNQAVTFSMDIQFKDGKIRFDVPVIGQYEGNNGMADAKQWINFQGLYSKAKEGLEPEMNNLVMQIIQSSFTKDNDW